jgi:hypothetical protein
MGDPFSNPSGQRLLADLRAIFRKEPIFQTRGRHIVFVCGGSTKGRARTMRRAFLEWSKVNFLEIIPILAEDAFRPTEYYDPPTNIDLVKFETIIGEIADCVVVFPESVGSYAEIGYFAAKRTVSRKILVANYLSYQTEDSFLNLGPIRVLDHLSFLKPTVQLPRPCTDFSPLKRRLKRLIPDRKRRRFEFRPYWQLDYKAKFLVTLQLISLLQPIDLAGLNLCVEAVFESTKPQEIGHIVAILYAAKYLRAQDDRFALAARMQPLLEFRRSDAEKLRSGVVCTAPDFLDTELSLFMLRLLVQGAAGEPGLA